jgi:hypothetical protein
VINGAHIVIYSKDAVADRAFFRDLLMFPSVDAGRGWLIFALPAAEAAIHQGDKNDPPGFFLMCDDLTSDIATLQTKGVQCSEPFEARWGTVTNIKLPGGGQIGLYQPKHARP